MICRLMLIGVVVLSLTSSGWAAAPANDSSIVVLNAANLQASVVEAIRAHAEKELYVPVTARSVDLIQDGDLKSCGRKAASLKAKGEVCVIALVAPQPKVPVHATVMTNEQVAVINVSALSSTNELAFTWRLQRWTLRGAAFLMGIGPDPDPFCVMRDYTTLQDLDRMGLNFSPPWGDQFRKAAAARGLSVRPLFTPRPNLKKPAVKAE